MSVKQSDDKKWYARVSYKSGNKYKTKSKYGFKTKKEAQLWELDIHQQLNSGFKLNENPTFAEYYLRWFDVYKRSKLSRSSVSSYLTTHKLITSYFQDIPLKSITRMDYQLFLNEYGKTRARATTLKTNKHIRSCISDAVHNNDLKTDFTYKAEITGKPSRDASTKYLSQADTKRLINEVHNDLTPDMRSRYMIILALSTGMRYSEITGLTYDSIDYDGHTITVNKSWDYKMNRFKPTKTNNVRQIKVEPSILNILKEFIHYHKKKQLASYSTNPHKLVFAQFDGTPPSNKGVNNALTKACNRAGVRPILFHSLRHIHVSILLYNGMDISSIAKRVGHASTTTTADTYAHIIEELQNKADAISDNAIKELFS